MKISSILTVLMLVLSLCSTWAEGADDDYLNILTLIDQADIANGNGKVESAHAKYVDAWKQLTEFKRLHPTYSPSAVTYRLKYLTDKITTSAPKKVAPETGPAKATGGVQAKLISAGAEPRKVLRLHPQVGDKQSLGLTVKMSMEMATGAGAMPAMKLPAMQMEMEVTVKSVTAGDIAYETTITDASMAADPNASPQMAGGFDAAMANLKGTTVTGVSTDRGISKTVDFKLSSGASAQSSQTLDQVKTAMLQVALPEEEVGVGAKWSVQQKLKTQGMMVDQTETFEITALDDESVTLKSSLTQTAANQKIESPAAPGMKMDLTKMETKGTGTATVSLGKLMPTARATEDHTESSMGIDVGGKKQPMSMKMDVAATTESK